MKKLTFLIALLSIFSSVTFAQIGFNNDGSQPDPSAGVDVKFADKGMLIPRLTTEQIQAIPSPANGLMVYCLSDGKMYIFVGPLHQWKEVAYGPGSIFLPFKTCGDYLTVEHLVSNGVAPVDKTVIYGTVSGIPGEPSKCWISSNLGADHQATSVDDDSEQSAGWYWNFNHAHGYKHDGANRTPSSWPNALPAFLNDWQPSKDPCTIEIGNAWRIPTHSEWENVQSAGSWTSWNDAWSSDLKLHAAGFLNNAGDLSSKGSNGNYWSSTGQGMMGSYTIYYLFLDNSTSTVASSNSPNSGMSLRCLRCPEQTLSPSEGTHIPLPDQVEWHWNAVEGSTSYFWNTENDLIYAENTGSDITYTEEWLDCNTTYTRYVWAYGECGFSEPVILTSTTTTLIPAAPEPGIHSVESLEITWNWNSVPGATGYKWNTTNDYTSATDMGTDMTKTETGLTCATSYDRYVWSYNACENSSSTTLTASTSSCFICGDPLTINHVAGAVAPVSKTVEYGTVTNIPGETSKCWITSNLGADHQALSVEDATEPSAGWYWQFNYKQGYKHDGTTRTPNSEWMIYIFVDYDWQTANDPCNIEIGNGWRLPTMTEYYNIVVGGGWTNWNGPWNSALKLHAAGALYNQNGLLVYRGTYGHYWSSDREVSNFGYILDFSSSYCTWSDRNTAYGMPVRCLK